ncbi:MAG TPA: hypothetical protein VFC78_15625 [Tepidisphaeraceae bacterium]|nr:hypothetical protein [Tepidisphaeraceae bacterium]
MTERPQQTDHEAAYISENFGIPFTAALEIARNTAKKMAKEKARRRK